MIYWLHLLVGSALRYFYYFSTSGAFPALAALLNSILSVVAVAASTRLRTPYQITVGGLSIAAVIVGLGFVMSARHFGVLRVSGETLIQNGIITPAGWKYVGIWFLVEVFIFKLSALLSLWLAKKWNDRTLT